MAAPAELRWRTEDRGIGRVIPLSAPAPENQHELLDWALAAAAAAEQRIADLEERLAYLESLSVTDELTAVLNRRGLISELSRAIAAASRGGPRGVLAVCDLDAFKAINDSLGHRAGNEVLRQVAATLRRRVRKNDVVGRLGGDEFALLLIGTDLANARRKVFSLARAIAPLPQQMDVSLAPLAASFGLAAYDGSEDYETLLHRADMAMYENKRGHREGEAAAG